jgi:UPF0755 protein
LARGKRPQPSHERTEDERERDRIERARRRAARAGEPPPEVPASEAPIAMPAPGEILDAPPSPEVPASEDLEISPTPADGNPPPQPDEQLLDGPPVQAPHEEHAPDLKLEAISQPVAGLAPPVEPEAVPQPVEGPPSPVEPEAISRPVEGLAPPVEPEAVPRPVADPPRPVEPEAPGAAAADSQAIVEPVEGRSARGDRLAARVAPSFPAASPSASGRRGSIRSLHRPSRRSPITRVLALVALAAVVAAIVLVAKSLFGSGPAKTTPPVAVAKIVIPEGKTRLQIAQIASKDGLTGSYRAASKQSSLLKPTRYGAPASTRDLEGFLFPATYDVYRGAPVSQLVHDQLVAFGEIFGPKTIARAHALHVSPYGLLTVASMIEREAQVPGDRAKIAAVIYNRLHQGVPLGIDATIYYAVELRLGIATYTHELTETQLHINSAYNTRLHTGLPPTPISNPGVASIEAAAHPVHAAYLYYVAAADGCGEQVFSTSLAQFEANAAAYKAAVKKNGGAPPSCKKK